MLQVSACVCLCVWSVRLDVNILRITLPSIHNEKFYILRLLTTLIDVIIITTIYVL